MRISRRSTWLCRHGVDESSCPQCNQEASDSWRADQLAARDPESRETRERDLLAWLATDPQPSVEVVNG